MLVLAASILAAALLLAVALRAWLDRSAAALRDSSLERGWLDQLEVQPVLVELTDRRTLAGVLIGTNRDGLELSGARYLGDETVSIQGSVIVPRDRVAWIQRGIKIDDSAGPARQAA